MIKIKSFSGASFVVKEYEFQSSMDNELFVEQHVPYGRLTSISFDILTEAEAEKQSVLPIEGINDLTDPKLGVPNPTSQCTTCGAKDVKQCDGHFGVIRFPCTILHPYFISEVARVLNKICPGCKNIRRTRAKTTESTSIQHQRRNCKYCDVRFKDSYPTMKFKVSSKDIFGRTAIMVEVSEKLSKKFQRSSREVLAPHYWDIIPKDAQEGEIFSKPNKRVLTHAQVYHMLKDVDPRFLKEFVLRKNSLLLNCFPVTPNCHRLTEFGQCIVFDERTRAYKKLVDFRGTANELSSRVLDCLKISKIHSEKSSSKDFASSTSGSKYIKETLLGKRTDHIFRMVVVGDPNIKLSEIGLPCYIAERLQISEQLTSWNWEKLNTCCNLRILEKGEIFVRRKAGLVRVRLMNKLQIGDIIYRPLNDGDIVLINRPPSIHQHSLIALTVKVLPINSVLSINPLICSPFRGDFDGDCLHGYVPQSVDSRVELGELVALNRQLINGQSGRNLLSLSQDSLIASHLIVEDRVLLNLFQMQQLQMFCSRQLQLPAIAKALSPSNYSKATSPNACFWTGKQLFSMLLPSGFNYDSASNGVYIRNGELLSSSDESSWLRDTERNLFHSLVKHCPEEILDFLYAAQELLCEWLSMRGLSVSLSDLYLSSDSYSRENMIDEVSCGLQHAKQISHIKLLMVNSDQNFLIESSEESENAMNFGVERMCFEKQKSAALSRAYVSAFKQVFWDIQNLVYQYASKENSLLAMLKAGSKGNLMRLVQHGMCLGLQYSLVPLSFRIPHQLSCVAWNNHKAHASVCMTNDISECAGRYIPSAVIENSFLTGLNPLECFVHSLTTRDSSFSDNADLPGTLTRRLMFFMRDLCIGYDGTVRNAYGNQLVQFSYNLEDISPSNDIDGRLKNKYECGAIGDEPVGSLAACAISEAAYGALDQPISALETSPLLNLKKVLECGVKKISGEKTASLFLSKKLGRWMHGFEYAALEVQSHLERLLFSDIVSTAMIFFSPETCSCRHSSPWVCHFHICKEIAKKRRLRVNSIINALYMNVIRMRSKVNLPNLQITSKDCTVPDMQKESNATFCITVMIDESSKNKPVQLDTIRDLVIPCLLETVIKGFLEFKKVDILWNDRPNVSRSCNSSSGELYLRVYMSENCDRMRFWSVLKNNCLQIMDMIDWECSHPDDACDMALAYGIDVAWKYFLINLKSAISETGKCILPRHLLLVADCLSFSGEFVALNAKGLARQRKHISVSSPLTKAYFSNPGDCFIKAAKVGIVDNLQGSLDALSWGIIPSIGSGGKFDIFYSGKGHEINKPEDIYELLGSHVNSLEQNVKFKVPSGYDMSDKSCIQPPSTYGDIAAKGRRSFKKFIPGIRRSFSLEDILRLQQQLRRMLQKYPINHQLSENDKATARMALYFHPRMKEKFENELQEIKVGYHSEFEKSRCFLVVKTDGTVEDFSYHKCVLGALEIIAPKRAKSYQLRWLNNKS